MKFVTSKFSWRNRTIYAIPNRYGGALFGMFIVFIMAGAAYSNNLIFMMGFIILSFAFTSILQTARTIRNLEILSVNISSLSVGKISTGQIVIQNPTKYYKPKFEIELKEFKAKFSVPELQPHETRSISFSFQLPKQRGLYNVKTIRASTISPYGLFKAWMYIKVQDVFIVYPSMYGRSELPLAMDNLGEGFSGHRQYVSGDTYSRIDWKIYARTRNIFIKEFKDSSTKKVVIDWDKLKISNLEDRISQIALWVDKACQLHVEFGIKIPGYQSPIQTGLQHYHECMKELSVLKL